MIPEYVDAAGVEFHLSQTTPVKVIPVNLFSSNSLNSLSFALRKIVRVCRTSRDFRNEHVLVGQGAPVLMELPPNVCSSLCYARLTGCYRSTLRGHGTTL